MQGDVDWRRQIGGRIADLIGRRSAQEELKSSEVSRRRELEESGSAENHEPDSISRRNRGELPGELLGALEPSLPNILRLHRAGEIKGYDDVAPGSGERGGVPSPLRSRECQHERQYTKPSQQGAQPLTRNRRDG